MLLTGFCWSRRIPLLTPTVCQCYAYRPRHCSQSNHAINWTWRSSANCCTSCQRIMSEVDACEQARLAEVRFGRVGYVTHIALLPGVLTAPLMQNNAMFSGVHLNATPPLVVALQQPQPQPQPQPPSNLLHYPHQPPSHGVCQPQPPPPPSPHLYGSPNGLPPSYTPGVRVPTSTMPAIDRIDLR